MRSCPEALQLSSSIEESDATEDGSSLDKREVARLLGNPKFHYSVQLPLNP
jgi:hypothetical protein